MITFARFQRLAAALPLGFAFAASLCIAAEGAGPASRASQWVSSTSSTARLVSGTVEVDGKPELLAGIQLRIDDGWKTYWRNPGDSGVPPRFDWSGSKNLKTVEVLYPAPRRFADANGTAIGYDGEVTFPVRLVPEREGEPVALKLAFDYGLCKDLCIPAEVSLDLALPADAIKHPGDALLLASALELVPKPTSPGTLPKVNGIAASLDGPSPKLVIEALFPPNASSTDLFIEAGETFVPVPKPVAPPDGGRQSFVVGFASPAEAASIKGKPLTLTLVSDQGSTEATLTVE